MAGWDLNYLCIHPTQGAVQQDPEFPKLIWLEKPLAIFRLRVQHGNEHLCLWSGFPTIFIWAGPVLLFQPSLYHSQTLSLANSFHMTLDLNQGPQDTFCCCRLGQKCRFCLASAGRIAGLALHWCLFSCSRQRSMPWTMDWLSAPKLTLKSNPYGEALQG